MKEKIGVVVCSNAGTDYFDLDYPIKVMRSTLILDGIEYQDYHDITADEFYQRAQDEENLTISTAQCPTGVMMEILESMEKDGYTDIIAIVISKELSGIYQGVKLASESLEKAKLHLVDSKSVSFGQLYLVKETIKLIKEGKSAEQIVERLKEIIPKINILVMVDTLKFLVKNGRLSATSGMIGTMLKIKPILRMMPSGKLETYEKIRTKRKALERILQVFKEETEGKQIEVCICYTNNLDLGKLIEQEIIKERPDVTVSFVPLSPVVGAHAGPGTLGIGYVLLD